LDLRIIQESWLKILVYSLFGGILIVLPPFLSAYGVSLMTEILITGILVLSLNILVGYTGLTSIGHAAFFGVGAYVVAILSTRFTLGMNGLVSFLLTFGLAIIAALLLGIVFGLLVARLRDLSFIMVTLALAQTLWGIALSWRSITNGEDGLAGIARPDLGLPWSLGDPTSFYYFTLVFFLLSYFLLRYFAGSPFGHALIGIRESETRMKALGYHTWTYKYIAYVIAGVFGGLAGILYAYFNGYVNIAAIGMGKSFEPLFMVILGGRSIFSGPVIGAAVTLLAVRLLSSWTEYWQFFLGAIFILTVMYSREGIAHYVMQWIRGKGWKL